MEWGGMESSRHPQAFRMPFSLVDLQVRSIHRRGCYKDKKEPGLYIPDVHRQEPLGLGEPLKGSHLLVVRKW